MKTITIFIAALALVGAVVGSSAIIATLVAMAKFPLLLVAVLLACWLLSRVAAEPLSI